MRAKAALDDFMGKDGGLQVEDIPALRAVLDAARLAGVGDDPRGRLSVDAATAKVANLEAAAVSPERKEEQAWRRTGLFPILAKAKAWVEKEWPEDMPKILDLSFNSSLPKGGPAMQRFKEGVIVRMKERGLSREAAIDSLGFFAWHGTPSHLGMAGICKEGFDPKRRSGQVCTLNHGPSILLGLNIDKNVIAFVLLRSGSWTRRVLLAVLRSNV